MEHIKDFRGVLRIQGHTYKGKDCEGQNLGGMWRRITIKTFSPCQSGTSPAVLNPQLGDCSPADQSSGQESSNEGSVWL